MYSGRHISLPVVIVFTCLLYFFVWWKNETMKENVSFVALHYITYAMQPNNKLIGKRTISTTLPT